MKRLCAILGLMFLGACTAEGELEDPDLGVSQPDVGVPDASMIDAGDDDSGSVEPGDAGGTELCDPLAPACPAGQKCVPGASTGQSTCILRGTENDIGDACARTSDCVEGAACVTDDGATLCRELCDPAEVTSCAAGTFCTKTLGSNASIGVCAAAPQSCDIYAQDCASDDCVLLRNPADGQIAPYCSDAGDVAIGQRCGGGAGDCVAGAICIQAGADNAPTCHAVCRSPDVPCAQGACTGTSAADVDFCV